jgi:DMSO/TMAO reductase YedYZ molybdopterin-dependent catalytic subunit
VSSALVQLVTGFLNTLAWYPWPWNFVLVHRFLAYVVIGSILLHVAVKLPDIKYGLGTKVADGDVLTEVPWSENPDAHSNAGPLPPPRTPALTRRGLLAASGAGVGLVVATTVGQTITPLQSIGVLATRLSRKGPQLVPVNKTAHQARVTVSAMSPRWRLQVEGPQPFALALAEIDALATRDDHLPIACVEGWSVGAQWRGVPLLELVERAGGSADSRIRVRSLEKHSRYNQSYVEGPQVAHALLATHLNGERLDLDHGYPLRLIAPNRAGVLNTKWLRLIEVLS